MRMGVSGEKIFQLGRWALSRPRLLLRRSDEGLEMHDGDTVHIQRDWDDKFKVLGLPRLFGYSNVKIGVVFRK